MRASSVGTGRAAHVLERPASDGVPQPLGDLDCEQAADERFPSPRSVDVDDRVAPRPSAKLAAAGLALPFDEHLDVGADEGAQIGGGDFGLRSLKTRTAQLSRTRDDSQGRVRTPDRQRLSRQGYRPVACLTWLSSGVSPKAACITEPRPHVALET